jgi:hypothetical protein
MSIEALAPSQPALPATSESTPSPVDPPAKVIVPYEYGTPSTETVDAGFPAPFELRAARYIGALQSAFSAWAEARPHVESTLQRGLQLTCLNELRSRLERDSQVNANMEVSAQNVHREITGFLNLIGFIPPADYLHPRKTRAY